MWLLSSTTVAELSQRAGADMIREGVVTSLNADGSVHITPLGYREREGRVVLAPFAPSRTLENLRARGEAILNFTDDVRVLAGALTGRRDWPTGAASKIATPRLAAVLAHRELQVVEIREDVLRPEFVCEIVAAATHAPFLGFNRAQAAVLEAAILVSRLDFNDPGDVRRDMAYLGIAVRKTAGPQELEAWGWLIEAIDAHPRHGALERAS